MWLCFHNYYKTEIKDILCKAYIFFPILFLVEKSKETISDRITLGCLLHGIQK